MANISSLYALLSDNEAAPTTSSNSDAFLSNTSDGEISAVVDDLTEVCFASSSYKEKTSNTRSKEMNVKVSQKHL
ncbi:hypothetical protein E3N88_43315 [Mikania micrantha]|uniref:Uncharacterized protein n=1 Tax=Mikania micrantha TaxID=192012 RepID=A0A5N6LFA1_9ASTR|nr:hypothetical protein E3N88_43315 [Mikania micrantha]